jgi:ribosomal protein S18 acetylase RimI-like enzyme
MTYTFSNKSLATALYNAFQEEPFYVAIARQRTNQAMSEKEALLRYFDFSIQEAQQYGHYYTLDKPNIGASLWLKPLNATLEKAQSKAKKTFLKEVLGPNSLAAYEQMANLMAAIEKDIIAPDYWYLSILAVDPKYQGKGFGQQLLRPVLQQIDQLGVPTYLETFTEGNLHFYGKLGYTVALEYEEPLLQKTGWILVRKVGGMD